MTHVGAPSTARREAGSHPGVTMAARPWSRASPSGFAVLDGRIEELPLEVVDLVWAPPETRVAAIVKVRAAVLHPV
jgi:hypothetical protein